MSAGDQDDHFVQDACEAYLAWKLQAELESRGRNRANVSKKLQSAFDDYLNQRNVLDKFTSSAYKKNIDCVVPSLITDLTKHFRDQCFDIQNVEKEMRDLKRKGDIQLDFGSGKLLSVSVKNYKNGYKRIQLCSGTWNSFLNNFLFVADGVGMFIHPTTGERFAGSDRRQRDLLIRSMGFEPLIDVYKFIDTTNDKIRKFYIESDSAQMWEKIASKWKADCERYGQLAAQTLSGALQQIEPDSVKKRLIAMAGLNFDEELLLLGKEKFLCSISNIKYRDLLTSVNEATTRVEYTARGQTLTFVFRTKHDKELVSIEVPFTLQKNGAWHLPKTRYSGKQFHEKEGIKLAYGERRPKKSRELATSTNTYLDLGKAGVVSR